METDPSREVADAGILVIGAGPAGLAAAACLARRGLQSQIESAGGVKARYSWRRCRVDSTSRRAACHPSGVV